MAVTIENLEKAFDEMFDFITDLPSGLDGFESDFDAAFEELKELKELKATLTPPNEWVSVENALPEECADILLCRKILKIPEIGTYQQARFWVYDEIGDVYQVDDVTHWLPIPTPYDIEHIHISEPPEG